MRTCLEIRSMDERHIEEVRSDYNRYNQYNANHPDAKATGDAQGKGVGGGHTHWLPNCSGTIGIFNYSNFITDPSAGAGNDVDNATREVAMARSLYNFENAYSARIVDTTMNVREGQYRVP